MSTLTSAIKAFIADEEGVTAIEYGLIAALVGLGIAVAAKALGTNLSTLFGNIGTQLNAAVPAAT
jgi:pilus assembly protein Flp/PilA